MSLILPGIRLISSNSEENLCTHWHSFPFQSELFENFVGPSRELLQLVCAGYLLISDKNNDNCCFIWDRLQGQVHEVVNVMQDNISKVLDRGDKLSDLQDKSGEWFLSNLSWKHYAIHSALHIATTLGPGSIGPNIRTVPFYDFSYMELHKYFYKSGPGSNGPINRMSQ